MDSDLETFCNARPHANPNPGFKIALGALVSSSGNIEHAHTLWKKTQGRNMIESIHMLRYKAIELHGKLDALEERMARGKRSGALRTELTCL